MIPTGQPRVRIGRRTIGRHHAAFGLVAVIALIVEPALANPPNALADAPNAFEQPGAPTSADVYVNDSIEAVRSITRIRELADRQDWPGAAALLIQTRRDHAGQLIAATPGVYEPVGRALVGELADWPPAGRVAFRLLVDAEAARRLAELRQQMDVGAALTAVDAYLWSTAGGDIAELAVELALEAGAFTSAELVLDRLFASQDPADPRADRWRGLRAIVRTLRAATTGDGTTEIPIEVAGVRLRWEGAVRSVGEIVAQIRATARPPAPLPATHWPTFGGAGHRRRVAQFPLEALALLWEFNCTTGDGSEDGRGDHNGLLVERSTDPARRLVMQPVSAGGLVVCQEGHVVWAIRAESGTLAWRYALPDVDPESLGSEGQLASWYSPTLHRGRVFACLGNQLPGYYGYDLPDRRTAVVCLDARTGAEVWRQDVGESQTEFAEIVYDGSPLVVANRLWVIERRRRAFGFEDCFLVALDPGGGQEVGRLHLGGASTGGFGYRRPTLTILGADDEAVYVGTNLGTLAAVDAHRVAVRWLRVYSPAGMDGWSARTLRAVPWRYNAVMVTPEWLVYLPTDDPRVLVLDKRSGQPQHAVPASELGGSEAVIGVDAGRLYAVGDAVVAYDLDQGAVVWSASLPADDALFGRALLTRTQVLVPGRQALAAYDRQSGRRVDQPWEDGRRGGNLVALGDRLIVAGGGQVSVYANRTRVLEQLRVRLAANPTAPEPALDLAEISFRSGAVEEAVGLLDEAVRRAGGFGALAAAKLDQRVFNDALAFAAALRRAQLAADRRDAVLRLYDLAARCAPDVAGQIRHRLERAAFYAELGRPRAAIEQYMDILADGQLRDATLPRRTDDGRAGQWCARQIEALIAEHGSEIYAAHEQLAVRRVTDARSNDDVAGLVEVVAAFPNAAVTGEATLLLGRLLRDGGQPLAAARQFYQAWTRAQTDSASAGLVAELVRCYALAGRPRAARRWWALGRWSVGGTDVGLDGQSMSWSALAAKFGLNGVADQAPVPRLRFPLPRRYERWFAESIGLLGLALPPTGQTAWAHYYVWSESGITAYNAATDTAIWTEPLVCPDEPQLLHSGAQRLVLATPYELLGVDVASGTIAWRHGARPAGVGQRDADHEAQPRLRNFAVDDRRLVAMRSDGQTWCVDLESGAVNWMRRLATLPAGDVVLGPSLIAFPSGDGRDSLALVLDAATGATRRRLVLPDGLPVERVLLGPDDAVYLASARQLFAADETDGRWRWRTPASMLVFPSSVRVDVDGIYVATDGYRVAKLRMSDGTPIWHCPALGLRGDDMLQVDLRRNRVLVSGEDLTAVLATLDGEVLRVPPAGPGSRVGAVFVTDVYHLVVDLPFDEPQPLTLHAFGMVTLTDPADDATLTLAIDDGFQQMVICDGAVVVQDGRRILGFAEGP